MYLAFCGLERTEFINPETQKLILSVCTWTAEYKSTASDISQKAYNFKK